MNIEIKLSSCVKETPDAYIDLVNPPDDLEDIIQRYFADYTSGTNPAYMDDDKLAYIDLIRDKIHPEQDDEYRAVEEMIVDRFKYDIENGDNFPDADEYWNIDMFAECYKNGNKNLYSKQYGYKKMDHHTYDQVHHTLVRIIKAVMNYTGAEGKREEN